MEPVFTKMQDNWSEINSTNYNILDVSSLTRFIKSQLKNVLEFLEKWIRTSHKSLNLKKDHRELAVLAVILLGGSLLSDFESHHSCTRCNKPCLRLMDGENNIYTLKTCLLQNKIKRLNFLDKTTLEL